jgi:hypothetical protein
MALLLLYRYSRFVVADASKFGVEMQAKTNFSMISPSGMVLLATGNSGVAKLERLMIAMIASLIDVYR